MTLISRSCGGLAKTQKIPVRIDDGELLLAPGLQLQRAPGMNQTLRLTIGVQRFNILDAEIARRVIIPGIDLELGEVYLHSIPYHHGIGRLGIQKTPAEAQLQFVPSYDFQNVVCWKYGRNCVQCRWQWRSSVFRKQPRCNEVTRVSLYYMPLGR